MSMLWVGLATYLQLARQPGVPAFDSLWAEDGSIFLSDALNENGVGQLVKPLAGYLHFLPRFLAGVAEGVPLRYAGWILAAGSALIVSLLSLYVFFASRRLLPQPWARATLSGLMVLIPAASVESLNNAASLHFFVIFPCFWALLHRPQTRGATVAASLVTLSATLIDPRTALLLPVAVWKVLRDRNRLSRIVATVFVGGLVLQAVIVFVAVVLKTDPTVARYPVNLDESRISDLPGLYGLRVVGPLLVGERHLDNAWSAFGWSFGYLALALALLLFVYGMRQTDRRTRSWLAVSLGYSAAYFVIPVMAWGTRNLWPFESFYLAGNRYTIYPILFLVTAVLLLLTSSHRPQPDRSGLGPTQIATLLFLGTLVIANVNLSNVRAAGPSWSQELEAAQARCRLDKEQVAHIPIAPILRPPLWFVSTSCSRVLR